MDKLTCTSCGKDAHKPKKDDTETIPSLLIDAKAERLPPGWKRMAGKIWCGDCLHKHYVIRAVVVPVARPVSCDWKAFQAALTTCWKEATSCANWVSSRLFSLDPQRTSVDKKLQKFKQPYLYPEVRTRFPGLDTRAVVSITANVWRCYHAIRIDTVWRADRSLASFRYPMPYPLSPGMYKLWRDDGGRHLAELKLGPDRITVALRGGQRYRRQSATVSRILAGEYHPVEFAVYTKPASFASRRAGFESRQPGGGNRHDNRVMLKMVFWMPKAAKRERDGRLVVASHFSSLLAVRIWGKKANEPWKHNDQLPRWIAEQNRRMDRLRDDAKCERRSGARVTTDSRREVWVRKHQNRMKTVLHQMTCEVAGFADRRGFAEVMLDLDDRGFVPSFPWFDFTTKLQCKLDIIGVRLLTAEEHRADLKNRKDAEKAAADLLELDAVLKSMLAKPGEAVDEDDENDEDDNASDVVVDETPKPS